MKFVGVENKARLAITLFVLALVLTLLFGLALYREARREVASERAGRLRMEGALLALMLPDEPGLVSDSSLLEILRSNNILAAVALFSGDAQLLARASTLEPAPDVELMRPRFLTAREHSGAADRVSRTEGGFFILESRGRGATMLVVAHPVEAAASPVVFYVLSYQVVAVVFGLGLLFLLVRWLLRPYRRMVEAARGSPVRASSAMSESEFVVETFQALIERLQAKERELANLHSLERTRADRSERFSERLITNIPSGLVTVNSAGVVTLVNQQAEEIFGPAAPDGSGPLSADRALRSLSANFTSFLAPAPRMIEMISQVLAHGTPYRREEVDVTHADGRVRRLGLSISPITDDGQRIEGALCLMTDLTEVIELRERMKLQESLANLGEMAAGLAHEFKNSLATIYGYVQLLEAQSPTELRDRMRLQTIDATLNEVRLLARLVTDFLNFARPQQLNLSQTSLKAVIDESVEEIRAILSESNIEITVEGKFQTMLADESMLKRVFVNLLRNAAEAIDPASPVKAIKVTGSTDVGSGGRYSHVRIRDTGSGISPADLPRIFIPFFTTKSRGYGIGLAIVQKILVAHGGSVSVEQSDSSGTVFDCRLPLVPPYLTMK